MVFPEKPTFFDLNELECRLLAPRIAFQKLMQAPRGRQFKVHGNIVSVQCLQCMRSVFEVSNSYLPLVLRASRLAKGAPNTKNCDF